VGAIGVHKPLKDGGYAITYTLTGGMTMRIPHPPEGFNPLTASGEELEEYAIPPRPADPESLGEWEEEMMEYQAPTSPTAPACRISAETELSSLELGPQQMSTGEEEESEYSYWTSPIWSGYVALDPPTRVALWQFKEATLRPKYIPIAVNEVK
jgi:hypothetical protein